MWNWGTTVRWRHGSGFFESMWGCPNWIMVYWFIFWCILCFWKGLNCSPIACQCGLLALHWLIQLNWHRDIESFKGTFGIGTCGWYQNVPNFGNEKVTWQSVGRGPHEGLAQSSTNRGPAANREFWRLASKNYPSTCSNTWAGPVFWDFPGDES